MSAHPVGSREWLDAAREDVHLFALEGLGIDLHAAQTEVAQAIVEGDAQFYLLTWANRAGKTTIVGVIHMWFLFFKRGLERAKPGDPEAHRAWLATEYRTLHTAPLNELAGRAYSAWNEITKGTSVAQRDPVTKERRPAPLAAAFTLTKERNEAGADKMFLRCIVSGAVCDFRSTEGKATRLEGGTWYFISWDEWPQQENTDDIRTVLEVRLLNRASDFDAKILLTGTLTDRTEHIASDWLARCEDPDDPDWWGNHAQRSMNPSASTRALDLAARNMDPEDYARTVMGTMGGVRGRLFPSFMLDPVFRDRDLPRFQPPAEGDGAFLDEKRGRFRARPDGVASPWTYLHLWDVAIAEADNVGTVWRVPADWRFSVEKPIVDVKQVIIPGSRTLTSAEIIHTMEETYLPYGGLIVVDTTDAHGKNIHRELRRAGYPVEEFTFNERDSHKVIRKDAAIKLLRDLLCDGMVFELDSKGEPVYDSDGIPKYDRAVPYGALRAPAARTKTRDQLSVLRDQDKGQRKDCAMTYLMGAFVAMRARRARTREARPIQRLPVNIGGRPLVEVRRG